MKAHFLDLQIAELAFVGDVGVHAQHGEPCAWIKVRHLVRELIAASL